MTFFILSPFSRFSFMMARFSCGVLEATGRVECWGEGALGDAPSLDFLEGQLVDKVGYCS